jgi:hypothetical protein
MKRFLNWLFGSRVLCDADRHQAAREAQRKWLAAQS